MTLPVPADPKIYHILHVDKLAAIASDKHLWCDAEMARRAPQGTTIGMSNIKRRRLATCLASHEGLRVADCVPFYFCPRSIMLYVIHQANHPELSYRGGQGLIVHLEANLGKAVEWAQKNALRWAFTLSNAGASYFEDRCELDQLSQIDWDAVQATNWRQCKEGKQAEFLIESRFPWQLVERIGACSLKVASQVRAILASAEHQPVVERQAGWYY
jgi:hypothetical protein